MDNQVSDNLRAGVAFLNLMFRDFLISECVTSAVKDEPSFWFQAVWTLLLLLHC